MSGNLSPRNRGLRRNISCCSGVSDPSTFWIMYIWSISLSPGNKGCPSMSSPNMHPMAQMSTDLVYVVDPSSSSGARYLGKRERERERGRDRGRDRGRGRRRERESCVLDTGPPVGCTAGGSCHLATPFPVHSSLPTGSFLPPSPAPPLLLKRIFRHEGQQGHEGQQVNEGQQINRSTGTYDRTAASYHTRPLRLRSVSPSALTNHRVAT